jgi:Ni,Fe-hydrogenase III large subunit
VSSLSESDREAIERARELGPVLRASGSDRDRLAGWLLKTLADLAERLGETGNAGPG